MEVFDLENPGQTITVDSQSSVPEDYNDRLIRKRENLLKGNFNVLPFPFKRASYFFPGLERGSYTVVAAETKHGKSQTASYAFIFMQLWNAYHNRKLKLKYLYLNLEESENRIKDRIVCFLLYKYTDGRVRIGYRDLNSSTIPLAQEVIDILEDDGFKDIRDFFFNHIEFNDSTYPTGIAITIDKFFEKNGKVTKGDSFTITDNITGKTSIKQRIIGYTQNDPEEFLIVFADNFNNVTPERGQTLLQAITTVSKNFKDTRNKYNAVLIGLQQINAEADSMDAFKQQRIEPRVTQLADCRQVSRDLNSCIGILSPYMKFEGLPNGDPRKEVYRGYNIKKLGNYFRALLFLSDRDGESAKVFPLYFDGKVCVFEELPKADDVNALELYYNRVEEIHRQEELDQQIKEEYKRTNGVSTSFFTACKDFNNVVAKSTFKQYLCRVFHKIFN